MSSHNQIPFAIFSASQAGNSAHTNELRNRSLHRQLIAQGLDIQPVRGSYQGVEEDSVLVLLPEGDADPGFDVVYRLSAIWQQDSFLFVDSQRIASLHYSDGRVEFIGHFHSLPETEARQRDGWTRDVAGNYYAVSA